VRLKSELRTPILPRACHTGRSRRSISLRSKPLIALHLDASRPRSVYTSTTNGAYPPVKASEKRQRAAIAAFAKTHGYEVVDTLICER
jgi:hypothetical protein